MDLERTVVWGQVQHYDFRPSICDFRLRTLNDFPQESTAASCVQRDARPSPNPGLGFSTQSLKKSHWRKTSPFPILKHISGVILSYAGAWEEVWLLIRSSSALKCHWYSKLGSLPYHKGIFHPPPATLQINLLQQTCKLPLRPSAPTPASLWERSQSSASSAEKIISSAWSLEQEKQWAI